MHNLYHTLQVAKFPKELLSFSKWIVNSFVSWILEEHVDFYSFCKFYVGSESVPLLTLTD